MKYQIVINVWPSAFYQPFHDKYNFFSLSRRGKAMNFSIATNTNIWWRSTRRMLQLAVQTSLIRSVYTLSTGHRGAVGGMHWTQFWWGVLVVVVKTHPFLREIKGWNRTHVWGNDLWIRLPYWVPPLPFPPVENNLNIWCTLTPPATVERKSEVNNQKKMPSVWQAITLRN